MSNTMAAASASVDAERANICRSLLGRSVCQTMAQTTVDPFIGTAEQLAEQAFIRRFWARVHKSDGDGCWLWTGARNRYGNVHYKGRHRNTHRVAYEITYGAIPDGLCVCHRCDVPLCVRPDHLWLGTKADNSFDMVLKGRAARVARPVPTTDLLPRLRRGSAALTDKQALVLKFITENTSLGGVRPSHRAICKAFGWRSTNAVADVLRALRKKGALA